MLINRKSVLICGLVIAMVNIAASQTVDYRQEMRTFVMQISAYGRAYNPNFIVIPQNGIEILTKNGVVQTGFVSAISGWGQEDLFFSDDKASHSSSVSYVTKYLDIAKSAGLPILVIDYCTKATNIATSISKTRAKGYLGFQQRREADIVPKVDRSSSIPLKPQNENANNIYKLSDAKNFFYLLNPGRWTQSSFITEMKKYNWDVLIIDNFDLTRDQVNALKVKNNGAKRLVISYMSIGEAEDYRSYWKNTWTPGNPAFLCKVNPEWEGNYKVKYWDPNWKQHIFGNEASFTKKIINAGFDGVYLDIIDGYQYFESNGGKC